MIGGFATPSIHSANTAAVTTQVPVNEGGALQDVVVSHMDQIQLADFEHSQAPRRVYARTDSDDVIPGAVSPSTSTTYARSTPCPCTVEMCNRLGVALLTIGGGVASAVVGFLALVSPDSVGAESLDMAPRLASGLLGVGGGLSLAAAGVDWLRS